MEYLGAWGTLIHEKKLRSKISCQTPFNPLPHGVLATFSPTAGGLMGPPKKDVISREKTILMTSLQTHRTSAVSSPGTSLHLSSPSPPAPFRGHCVHYQGTTSQLSRQLFEREKNLYKNHSVLYHAL